VKRAGKIRNLSSGIEEADATKEETAGPVKALAGVTVITATNRPQFIKNLFANYKRQQWRVKEIIVLLNHKSMSVERYKKEAGSLGQVSVYKLPPKWTLGKCLNFGIKRSRYEIIAKFDDDDYYARQYLTEAMNKFEKSQADLVGKSRFYMYFNHSSKLMLATMPGKGRVAGATMLFKKAMYPAVSFKNLKKGTDMRFQRDSLRHGFRVESTGPNHFAALRRVNQRTHTWKVTKRTIKLLRAKKVAQTVKYRHLVQQAEKLK
jgi:hypothetical protein